LMHAVIRRGLSLNVESHLMHAVIRRGLSLNVENTAVIPMNGDETTTHGIIGVGAIGVGADCVTRSMRGPTENRVSVVSVSYPGPKVIMGIKFQNQENLIQKWTAEFVSTKAISITAIGSRPTS